MQVHATDTNGNATSGGGGAHLDVLCMGAGALNQVATPTHQSQATFGTARRAGPQSHTMHRLVFSPFFGLAFSVSRFPGRCGLRFRGATNVPRTLLSRRRHCNSHALRAACRSLTSGQPQARPVVRQVSVASPCDACESCVKVCHHKLWVVLNVYDELRHRMVHLSNLNLATLSRFKSPRPTPLQSTH